jgi:hypothetical protein
MAPEYSKAALGLYPLIPAYAVDCDAEKNKQLCAEQVSLGAPSRCRSNNNSTFRAFKVSQLSKYVHGPSPFLQYLTLIE